MNFRKLRLTGFKSFVESTELLIEPGLTGIVGPNGCGKSNLVEALRWVMGETSARQLRGGEMDDVIFGGTSHRPSRNLAEVVLHLDNGDRRAPAQFNDHDELEVVRRISRGSGSVYRVNGREVRARDVQLLFADAASGARSTAMVSQGQIGAFIAAKPTQRRAVLEEAAGITGLHSRRHEAELRLRAAEANLERLEDVLTTLDSQLQGLRKQARQANRYRRLNDHIRRAEAQLFHVRWTRIGEEAAAADAGLEAARRRVAEATGAAAAAASAQSEAAAAVPPAREGEAMAVAELQRLLVARDGLAAEEMRIADARRAADARLLQARQDLERERARSADAAAALERLEAERAALVEAGAGETTESADSKARLEAVQGEVAGLDAEAGRLTRQIADAEAGRTALARQIADARAQADRLRRQLDDARRQHSGAAAQAIDPAAVAAAESASATAEAAVHAAQAEGDAAAEATAMARRDESVGRERVQATQAELARLRAEEAAIAGLLSEGDGDRWPPVIDSLRVDRGFESALGAALGDDLNAATDAAAPAFWAATGGADIGGAPALPAGAVPLSGHVHGAPVLVPRLEQVGVVEHADAALALRGALAVGQRLVSRDGGLWRWDGYTVAPGAESPAAKRLAQRNRLEAVRGDLPAAEAADVAARESLAGAQAAMRAAGEREARAREAARSARTDVDRLRRAHADLAQRAAVQQSRLAALADTVTRLETEAAESGARVDGLTAHAAALPDPTEAKARAEALRARLAERREALLAARTDHDRLGREIETRRRRIAAVADEALSWRRRADEAAGQRDTLEARASAEAATVAELAAQPAELAARRAALLDRIEASEARRKAAGDRLAEAEAALVERDRAAKQAEARLVELREAGIRAESAVERVRQASDALVERVLERLDCRPEVLGELAGLDAEDRPLDVDELERRAERLLRERDGMGAVNLRAEQESEALVEQLASLQAEREDLLAAIAKLRRGIAELDREGRQRLLVAFEQVNAHFMELFVRLFGGGEAHLALTESDDPLEAGLEIMASPPGKKMQILSLLSGGERALTALALLFAVFLTNPAPICVLDEVDAPLDDANVDRFCRMLEEIGRASSTRFLVVTHHRLTMARMDRLFGVTMAERGVSQLVSVDLRRAEGLRAIA